jgi:predicted  nucleic acid-binding Zn-ribbon protein
MLRSYILQIPALNELLATREPLTTPARKYVARLSETTERLRAQVSILQHEKEDLKQVVKARRDTKKGKRIALKGQILVST